MSRSDLNPHTPKLLRRMVIWALSICLSLAIGLGFIFLAVTVAGHFYDLRHPLAIGEDDLGAGLFAIFWAVIALVIAIPLFLVFTRLFVKAISKYFDRT